MRGGGKQLSMCCITVLVQRLHLCTVVTGVWLEMPGDVRGVSCMATVDRQSLPWHSGSPGGGEEGRQLMAACGWAQRGGSYVYDGDDMGYGAHGR